MTELERPVEVRKVVMVQNNDGLSWNAHVTIGTSNPDIEFGTFVIENVKTPIELDQRMMPEMKRFLEDEIVNKKEFTLVN